MAEKKRSANRRWIPHALRMIGLLIGAGIMFYPTISSRWNRYRDSQLLTKYEETVAQIPEDEFAEARKAAQDYNDQHTVNQILDAFSEGSEDYILTHPYDTLLNPMGDEVMGSIEIPKIDVNLPIYHGVGAAALDKGVGHIEGTSLPIGGAGTHTVLSGHRGLPGRKLFTDLDLIEEGDLFYLHILGDTLAYQVDQILTVLPSETEALAIEPEMDLTTLVTCTPYGINSHRLLIRGHRIPYSEEKKQEQKRNVAQKVQNAGMEERLVMIGLAVFFSLCIVFWIISEWQIRHRGKKETDGSESD